LGKGFQDFGEKGGHREFKDDYFRSVRKKGKKKKSLLLQGKEEKPTQN